MSDTTRQCLHWNPLMGRSGIELARGPYGRSCTLPLNHDGNHRNEGVVGYYEWASAPPASLNTGSTQPPTCGNDVHYGDVGTAGSLCRCGAMQTTPTGHMTPAVSTAEDTPPDLASCIVELKELRAELATVTQEIERLWGAQP